MGTNYGAFIAEALRVVKHNGWIWIAEVRSRFANTQGQEDYAAFIAALQLAGLKIARQDTSNTMFVVFEAQKHIQSLSGAHEAWPSLKACQYKRR